RNPLALAGEDGGRLGRSVNAAPPKKDAGSSPARDARGEHGSSPIPPHSSVRIATEFRAPARAPAWLRAAHDVEGAFAMRLILASLAAATALAGLAAAPHAGAQDDPTWTAWVDRMPPGPPALHVLGTITLP